MIKVDNLSYKYPRSNTEVIKCIDFDIKKGEIFGFLGPSGAGKTTTQRILIGLLRGYNGSVSVMGRERNKWGRDYFEHIGVAFDFPNLYVKLTAAENLKVIGAYYQQKVTDIDFLLDKVGLLPDRDKKVESFSKGMKMRLNFIRSIMHNPQILFFDEPTSGLDPVNAKIIKDIILELKNEGKTVFLTTHNMIVAEQLCDRVAFLVEGQIKVLDSPNNLKITHGNRIIRVEYMQEQKIMMEEFDLNTIGQNERFFHIMREYEIRTIHSLEATLEDIFIKLTGRELL